MTTTLGHQGFEGSDIPPSSVYNQCVRCGLCLPTCPTYLETLDETSSPRGRIALIKSVDEGVLDITDLGFMKQMSQCLDCRACEAVCPSGVEYGKILEPARAQVQRIVNPKLPGYKRAMRAFILGPLFGNMRIMRAVGFLLRFYQRSGLQSIARRSGILRLLKLDDLEAMAPRISERFFVPHGQHWPSKGDAKANVLLHAGCVMHIAFAEVHEATVRVLQRAGCNIIAPAKQGCCGAIAVHSGELERGRELAKANIITFEKSGADMYIVNAAGCGSSLKEYGHLFVDDTEWHARASAFSARVRDITEYLDEIGLPDKFGSLPMTVTYQEPCHLVHAQRIASAPRRLLALIPDLVVREMPESSLCCGSAGIYNVTQPEMAEKLQKRKIKNALSVAPQAIITANPGCALQLVNGLKKAQSENISVQHIVELLDASMQAFDDQSR